VSIDECNDDDDDDDCGVYVHGEALWAGYRSRGDGCSQWNGMTLYEQKDCGSLEQVFDLD
jgi:hypothetical protein